MYGSWVIGIELLDIENNIIMKYTQEDLSSLPPKNISNFYVAKIKPGKHSLIVPLGAKATLHLQNDQLTKLPTGEYTIKITDISGLYWEQNITVKHKYIKYES